MDIEDMTPAAQAMYLMSGGHDRDQETRQARKQKASPAAERMQASLDGLAEARERIKEFQGGADTQMEQQLLPDSETENRSEGPAENVQPSASSKPESAVVNVGPDPMPYLLKQQKEHGGIVSFQLVKDGESSPQTDQGILELSEPDNKAEPTKQPEVETLKEGESLEDWLKKQNFPRGTRISVR